MKASTVQESVGPASGILFAIVSFAAALAAAWLERFSYFSFGLSGASGVGYLAMAAVVLLLIIESVGGALDRYIALAATLVAGSLLVDQLPLLALGKSQLAVVLVGSGQWLASKCGRNPNWLRCLNSCLFLVLGGGIEAAYFFALLRGHHFVGIF